MSRLTVDQLQSRIAALVDQDPDTSAISTDDYSLRLTYLNMALHEWQETYDWQALYKEYGVLVSTSTGNASLALPADFRKLAGFPKAIAEGTTREFPETRGQDATSFLDTDRRIEVLGNPADGYTLRLFGVTLASGASVTVPYYASAGSLATTSDIASIPNADYLIRRTVAYLWEAREDPRFPQMKQEADRILANMLERENTHSEASTFDRVRTTDETRHAFRWGRE